MSTQARPKAKPAAPAIATVPIGTITASPNNLRKRFDDDALARLAETIKAHGILQPLVVRPKAAGRFELVAGERRFRAAKLARLSTVPVSIRALDDAAALEIMVIENDSREDISPLERAEGYKRLIDMGRKIEHLAAKVGSGSGLIKQQLFNFRSSLRSDKRKEKKTKSKG